MGSIRISSLKQGEVPPDFPIEFPEYHNPSRLLDASMIILLIPGVLGLIIWVRAITGRSNQKVNWVAWMSWIGLGSGVYWLTIIRPADFEGLAAMAGA